MARSRSDGGAQRLGVHCGKGCEDKAEVWMQVRDGMSKVVLTVGPGHTLREAARAMSERRVGAAVVMDPDGEGPGIVTERDILDSVGQGQDIDAEVVSAHLTARVVYAAPDWSLEKAAAQMVRGGFRHLIVMEAAEVVGVLSVRDVVRCWTDDGASCDVPEAAGAA
jgi:CBS domain-containing protein